MNPDLDKLYPYPFERLAKLLEPIAVANRGSGAMRRDQPGEISLSIGEPRHPPPPFILEALQQNLSGLGAYPTAAGIPALRQAIAQWACRRFMLGANGLDPERQVLPVTGTREGLFSFTQAVIDRSRNAPTVMMPNPFYQIYEGAALLAGAQPFYMNTIEENGFVPDLDAVSDSDWARCQLMFVCSPGNPTGAVLDRAFYTRLLELADRHDFIIAADECYSEIYNVVPTGLLEVCRSLGRSGYERCVAFHSLSKRSSVPGLRSGFVAGDARIIDAFRRYRTYHGCAMPLPVQHASIPAWQDETHVTENRALYRRKFDDAMRILDGILPVTRPPAAFYLWVEIPGGDDERFVSELYAAQNLIVLPGSYLSRPTPQGDPGAGRVRISLVPMVDECAEAMQRIRDHCR